MIKVENSIVNIGGLSIEFDSSSSLNSFLLDYIKKVGKVVEVKVENKIVDDVLNSLILEYGLIEIENLDLSIRAYNILKRAGVNFIEDILKLDYNTVSTIRNMGNLSMIEIQGTVNRFVRYDYINWSSNLNIIA